MCPKNMNKTFVENKNYDVNIIIIVYDIIVIVYINIVCYNVRLTIKYCH